MRTIYQYFKKNRLSVSLTRYILGISMIPYGLAKILKIQFNLPGFVYTQEQTLETINSRQLAWAFLGHSGWFQILLGLFELVPAVLLLFRKTYLLGAFLMLPVILNVLLVNYAYNLWESTKLISALLLILNSVIFILEWAKIKKISSILFDNSKYLKKNWIKELVINTSVLAFILIGTLPDILRFRNQVNEFTGDWPNNLPIEWILTKDEKSDNLSNDQSIKLYFWTEGICEIRSKLNSTETFHYEIDRNKKTLKLFQGDTLYKTVKYEFIDDETLKWEEVNANFKSYKLFRKRIINSNIQSSDF